MKTKVQPWYGGRRPERSQRLLRSVKISRSKSGFQRGVPVIILNEHLVQLAVPHIHAAKIAVAIVLPIPIHLRAARRIRVPAAKSYCTSHSSICCPAPALPRRQPRRDKRRHQRIFIMPHEEAAARTRPIYCLRLSQIPYIPRWPGLPARRRRHFRYGRNSFRTALRRPCR